MSESYRPSRKLRLSPWAWLKWQYLCHAGPTEVAGFGLSAEHDLLYLEDIVVIGQHASPVTVALDDVAVADFFDHMVDLGIPPDRFARIWLHSHPGASATPSSVDEATFTRVFGACDWAIMGILSRAGNTYARLQTHAGPGCRQELPIAVDWQSWPQQLAGGSLDSQVTLWHQEYLQHVQSIPFGFSEGLEEEPRAGLTETHHPDLLTWSELLEYSYT
jgi:proteasome lid subunit RPN8/RPN11